MMDIEVAAGGRYSNRFTIKKACSLIENGGYHVALHASHGELSLGVYERIYWICLEICSNLPHIDKILVNQKQPNQS